VANPSALRLTQLGAEAWFTTTPALLVTQVGIEVWRASDIAAAAARPSVCVMT
jgi:hypothetical protein